MPVHCLPRRSANPLPMNAASLLHGRVLGICVRLLGLGRRHVLVLIIAEVVGGSALAWRRDRPLAQRLAHVREQTLGLLVLLLLARLRLLQQGPRLLVLRVKLHDLLAARNALLEILQSQIGLRSCFW